MIYMLRHTQLLPRQMLMILDLAVKKSKLDHGTYSTLYPESVRSAVEEIETRIAQEVFTGFACVFRHAERLVSALFGNCRTVLSYDELEVRWRRFGKRVVQERDPLFDFSDLTAMLLRMGIMGIVTEETERYYETRFSYDVLRASNIGPDHELALHPIFSTFCNAAGNEGMKPVLPHGALWPEEECE